MPHPGQLPDIERELATGGFRLRFQAPWLEHLFQERQREEARPHNRITIPILTFLFDTFVLSEIRAVPEIVALSLWLRLAVQTPLTLLFVVLDRRSRSNRWSEVAAASLIVLPIGLTVVESIFAVSASALAYFQAVPLIKLAILTCRIKTSQAFVVCALSTLMFTGIVLTGSFVPARQLPSLLLIDISLSVIVLIFAGRLDHRDRQVFLLNRQADIGREMLAGQNRMLARLTQLDPLTGVGNRRCFDTALTTIWTDERQQFGQVALVMFDIDCFKQFNDCFGHQSGDECLAAVARAVACCLRERDVLARYGGEEFAVILPETDIAEAWAVADRVRLAVLEQAIPHPKGGVADHVTVSLGVAAVVPAAQSRESLIEMADRCLYDAKRAGRNRTMADGFCPIDLSAAAMLAAPALHRTVVESVADTAVSSRH